LPGKVGSGLGRYESIRWCLELLGTPDDAVNFIALGEKQFGQVGTILPGDAGDDPRFMRKTPSREISIITANRWKDIRKLGTDHCVEIEDNSGRELRRTSTFLSNICPSAEAQPFPGSGKFVDKRFPREMCESPAPVLGKMPRLIGPPPVITWVAAEESYTYGGLSP